MIVLQGTEKDEAWKYLQLAIQIGKNSTCEQAKYGSVIINDHQIVGSGFNSPPKNSESQRRCQFEKFSFHPKITDKTCCIHAEQRAIFDALEMHPDLLEGATIYVIRLTQKDIPVPGGKPFCTLCSKMCLDVGIKNFVLWQKDTIEKYDTEEYNDLSFSYQE